MSRTEASAAATGDARATTLRGLLLCAFLLAPSPAAFAATPGKIYFFATRDACVTSGAFAARDCAAAFANARAQMREKAPRFSAATECRLHFHLCEPVQGDAPVEDVLSYAPAEATAFAPMALGVEMIASAKGVEAAPTLAVETASRIFPYYPVSQSYEEKEGVSLQAKAAQERAAILAPDRFVPFSRRKPFTGEVTFAAAALGAIEGATASDAETREQRRLRLKSAPFVR